jgi:sigma-B regulation protein RsbU (phosphoserine phosphatase)
MDGLTLLARINEMRRPGLKCIMVSAYGDMDNIRQAMNSGAFDFATKPIDLDDLQRTIDKAVEQIAYVKEAEKERGELRDLHSDLSVAREIQHAILPREFRLPKMPLADTIDLHASMEAAKDVGGDFYDFFCIDDTHLGFTMADVSGKGIPAAIFMAVSRTLIKATGMHNLSSAAVMHEANNMLASESLDSMFVTVFYGVMDLETGHIDYTNAGHNQPYVLHPDGSVEALPTQGNMALGAFEGLEYKSGELTLAPGDMLVTYTDGVTEAENESHEQFGEEALAALLPNYVTASAAGMVEGIRSQVQNFVGGAPQSDDITVLVIKRKG